MSPTSNISWDDGENIILYQQSSLLPMPIPPYLHSLYCDFSSSLLTLSLSSLCLHSQSPHPPLCVHSHIRCFRVASLPWYQKRAAGFFGTLPTSSYDEAISYFQASEETNSRHFTPNSLFLGKCHMELNNKAEAKRWFTKVIEEDSDPSDPDHKEVTLCIPLYLMCHNGFLLIQY